MTSWRSGGAQPSATDTRTLAELFADAMPASEQAMRQAALDAVTAGLFAEPSARPRIGRFEVLAKIGVGGMGVVYAAHDPRLRRKVALKFVGGTARDPIGREREQARLLREGQALARLAHPNVVAVYDVGVFHDQVFLAMEYVAGETLATWQARTRPSPSAVLAVYIAAGRGLAAAHAAGIVHRDFKPQNVILGEDGRARVLDFGLALRATDDETDPHDHAGTTHATPRSELAGTPAYMAPEQVHGRDLGPAADQYSFCVALHEALHGRHPASGQGAPRRPGLPGRASRIERALLRGLARDPSRRWPTMTALLAELERPPQRRRGRVVLGVALVSAVVVGVGASHHVADAPARACSSAAAPLLAVWGQDRRDAARRAVLATGVPFAATTWTRVAGLLDARASEWAGRRVASCVAIHAHGEPAMPVLARRGACIDAGLRELDALAQVLIEVRPDTVERAVAAAADLRPLAACDDEAALLATLPAPDDPALATTVDALRHRLARVEALAQAGDPKAALREARAAQAAAEALAYPPLVAEATRVRGHAALLLTRSAEAVDQLEATYRLANQQGRADLVALAAVDLVDANRQLARLDVAETWARIAGDALVHDGAPPARVAALLEVRARIAHERGRPGEALALAEQALAHHQRAPGEVHPGIARSYNELGVALQALGRGAEAITAYDRGLAQIEADLGVGHPDSVALLNNRSKVLRALGRVDEALAGLRRGLEIRARVYGTNHPRYAFSLAQIGDALTLQGKYGEAARYLESALEIRTRALGPDHPEVGETLLGLGKLAFLRGDGIASLHANERALAVLTRADGPDSDRVANAKFNLVSLYGSQGKSAPALVLADEVLRHWQRTLPADHPKRLALRTNRALLLRSLGRRGEAIGELREVLALQEHAAQPAASCINTLHALASTQLDLGAADDAIASLERALALGVGQEDREQLRAKVELALATALWTRKRDRPRARALAMTTAAGLRAAGPDGAELLKQAEAWFTDRGL